VGWRDALKAGQDVIDPATMDAAAQAERFGYNCDYVACMPLPRGSQTSDHGLLCVNNEYPSLNVMFPGITEDDATDKMTAEQVALCNMATGHSVVEIKRTDGVWAVVQDSPMNRRFTLETEFAISGPVAGHDWMKTSYDPAGRMVQRLPEGGRGDRAVLYTGWIDPVRGGAAPGGRQRNAGKRDHPLA
jgi:uncharacterized protein